MKSIKYLVMFLMVCGTIFFACKKEEHKSLNSDNPNTRMRSIQIWYERQVLENKDRSFIKENIPDWKNASSSMVASGLELVTVPLYSNGKVYKELNINNKKGQYTGVIKRYTVGIGVKTIKLEFFTLNGRLIEEGQLVDNNGYRYIKNSSGNNSLSNRLMMASGEPGNGGWLPEVDITSPPSTVIPLPFEPNIPPIIVKPLPTPPDLPGGGGGGWNPAEFAPDGYPWEMDNNLVTPCLKKALDRLLSKSSNYNSINSRIRNIINDFAAKIPTLGNTTIPKSISQVVIRFIPSNQVDVAQAAPRFVGDQYHVVVRVNENYFLGETINGEKYPKSEELFAQAIVHEILHVYASQTMMALDNYQQHEFFAKVMIWSNAEFLHSFYGLDRKEAFGLAWAGIDPNTMNLIFKDLKLTYPDGSVHIVTKEDAITTIANHMRFNKENGLGTPLECD